MDNLGRPGSESNRAALAGQGVHLSHGDIRCTSDLELLPAVDYVIDAAANPSALAGVDGKTSSRQLLEHNLLGTINMLEYCRRVKAGFILLSTSRVYSVAQLASLPVTVRDGAFYPTEASGSWPVGLSDAGVNEDFPLGPPASLYGAAKIASEVLALEYGGAYDLPVWINRCGVLAGPGQFGHAEQGIFSYWLHAWRARRPLRYIGFGGHGHQVRDALSPQDLCPLLERQMAHTGPMEHRVFNLGGGAENALSLLQLSRWCERRFGAHEVTADMLPRPFDIPWLVMDSGRAAVTWGWRPTTPLPELLDQIARFADNHPDWLDRVGCFRGGLS